MARYFIQVSYKGTAYSGFQIQKNGNTVQQELENALTIYLKKKVLLTGSSRTDAGVHALKNFFHFDLETPLEKITATGKVAYLALSEKKTAFQHAMIYSLNAILPRDIVVHRIIPVDETLHCRFDAIARQYEYHIYQQKNPFLEDRAFFYPYKLDIDKLNIAARVLFEYEDFTSFSKRNTQVKNFICNIKESEWHQTGSEIIFKVKANRFLRGMVKGLVGTMLRVGRGTMSIEEFRNIIESKDCRNSDFSVASHGLFLVEVSYPRWA